MTRVTVVSELTFFALKLSIVKAEQNQILESVENRVFNFGGFHFFGTPILRTNRNFCLDPDEKCIFRKISKRHFWALL